MADERGGHRSGNARVRALVRGFRVGRITCTAAEILHRGDPAPHDPGPWPEGFTVSRGQISSFTVIEDGPNVMAALVALCREVPVAGKQIHDANIHRAFVEGPASGETLHFGNELCIGLPVGGANADVGAGFESGTRDEVRPGCARVHENRQQLGRR